MNTVSSNSINRKRYLNVIFSDTVRPNITLLGASLDKDDLTAGLKQDQTMHTIIAGEYNKKNVKAYDGNAFPDIVFTRNLEANVFADIDWQKSKETFSLLSNEYDKCFYNWKQSGYHGDFPDEEGAVAGTEKLPFGDFTNGNKSMLYMHRFVYQFPDCLSKITGETIICYRFNV